MSQHMHSNAMSIAEGNLDSLSLDTIFLSNAPNELDEPTGDGYPIVEPNENDVLLGRGGRNNRHSGNNVLRQLARGVWQKYHAATKREKPLIAEALVENIRDQSPSGRFLKFDPSMGEWQEVPFPQAREKACQCLRDTVAIMIKAKKDTPVKPIAPTTKAPVDPGRDQAPKKPQRTMSRRDSFPPVRTVSAELEDMAQPPSRQPSQNEDEITLTLQPQVDSEVADLEPIGINPSFNASHPGAPSPMEVTQNVFTVMNTMAGGDNANISSSMDVSRNSILRQTGIAPGLAHSQPISGLSRPQQSTMDQSQRICTPQAAHIVPSPQNSGYLQHAQQPTYSGSSNVGIVHSQQQNNMLQPHQAGLLRSPPASNLQGQQEDLLRQRSTSMLNSHPDSIGHFQQQNCAGMSSTHTVPFDCGSTSGSPARAPDFETQPFQKTFFSGLNSCGTPQLGNTQLKGIPMIPASNALSLRSVMGLNAVRGLGLPPKQTKQDNEPDLFSAEALEGITWEGEDMSLSNSDQAQSADGFRKHISQLLNEIELFED